MKKTIMSKSNEIPLSSVVTPATEFVRSSNVERDTDDGDFLVSRYILDASVIDVVQRLVNSMSEKSYNRAFSITGSYGSGKSTLAVFLSNLLSPTGSQGWKQATMILDRQSPGLKADLVAGRKAIKVADKGFIRCIVTSRTEPIVATIVRALEKGARSWYGDKRGSSKTLKRLTGAVAAVNKATKHGNANAMPDAALVMDIVSEMCEDAPVIILLDEFGKNLEYFSHGDDLVGDLFIMQMLAEACSGKKKIPLFVLTMQHMAFEEYSSAISTSNRKEWAKIQGRFEDVPFSNSPQQIRNLVASFLTPNPKRIQERKRIDAWAKSKFSNMKPLLEESRLSKDQIARCYPMHPLSLAVLPELCSRYGQHERTLLSFISSSEKNGIPEFIDNATMPEKGDDLPSVGLDVLYDYFIAEHRTVHTTHSPSNMNRMMEIYLGIRDSNNLTPDELRVLKTIGLLNLLGTSGPFGASSKVLEFATGSKIGQVLRSLQNKSIITYRKHSDEYRIWRGSDMDIQSAIHNARIQLEKAPLVETLKRVKSLKPVIASKHAITSGTMRVFECSIADSSIKELPVIPQDVDGIVLYWAEDSEDFEGIPTSKHPMMIVRPSGSLDKLRDAAIHVAAIDDILATNSDIADDWVAKGELYERRVYGMNKVNEEFEELYGRESKWSYVGPDQKRVDLDSVGSAAASEASDRAYSKCPVILNEMLNRFQISTQSARARNLLINGMINSSNQRRFSIEGWGPERAMYEAVFAKTSLHKKTKSKWKLVIAGSTIQDVLVHIEKIMSKEGRVNLNEIYAELWAPPYGIKSGLVLVLIMIVLYNIRNKIALYEHGTLCTNLAPEIIERMTKNPSHFEVKYFGQNVKRKQELVSVVGNRISVSADTGSIGLMDVVGNLIHTVSTLPKYTKQATTLYSENATVVRNVILRAVEPDVMLFESIPKSLGHGAVAAMNTKEINKFADHLAGAMEELVNAYPRLLEDLRRGLYDGIGLASRSKIAKISSDLKDKISADPHTQGIFNALAVEHLDDDDWINYFAMVLVNSPTSEWTDAEQKLYDVNLAEFTGKVKRLMALHHERLAGKTYDNLSRIAITQSDGKEFVDIVALNDSQEKVVRTSAKSALEEILKKKQFKNKEEARKALLVALSKM